MYTIPKDLAAKRTGSDRLLSLPLFPTPQAVAATPSNWAPTAGTMLHAMSQGHNRGITSMAVHQMEGVDGSFLYTTSEDGFLKEWNMQNGDKLADYHQVEFGAGKKLIYSCNAMIATDHGQLLTAHADHSVKLWNIEVRPPPVGLRSPCTRLVSPTGRAPPRPSGCRSTCRCASSQTT